jgi:hypothetical protein
MKCKYRTFVMMCDMPLCFVSANYERHQTATTNCNTKCCTANCSCVLCQRITNAIKQLQLTVTLSVVQQTVVVFCVSDFLWQC